MEKEQYIRVLTIILNTIRKELKDAVGKDRSALLDEYYFYELKKCNLLRNP